MAFFTDAAIGGALIGAAVGGLLLVNGRIAGVSGILGAAVNGQSGLWRWTFLAGLIAAGWLAPLIGLGGPGPEFGFIPGSFATLAIAGVLVGFGTAIGTGCTSGHGVCGLSNLSFRSFAAVAIFMTVAAVTVFLTRHLGA